MGEGRARRAEATEGDRTGERSRTSLPAGFESPLAHDTEWFSSDSAFLTVTSRMLITTRTRRLSG